MKNRVKTYIIGLTIVSSFIACDKVDDPYSSIEVPAALGDAKFNDTVFSDTNNTRRKILFEEFTGVQCQNCPKGTAIAKKLKEDHPQDLILVAVHNSASFSLPDPTKGYPDFRTDAGQSLQDKYYGFSAPAALLNRIEFSTGKRVIKRNVWENEINTILQSPVYQSPDFKVKIMSIYNSKSGVIELTPRIEALKDIDATIIFAAYILESKINASQLDGQTIIPNYEHNHVLRKGFPANGQGISIMTNPTTGSLYDAFKNDKTISTSFNSVNWKSENATIVAFIYRKDNDKILHCEEFHLTSR